MNKKYKPHPVSEIFPMMSETSFNSLKEDIKEHGLQSSGLLYEGKILDGRNRYRACCELGVEMPWQEVELGEDVDKFDPVAYAVTHNLHRRQLTDQQRAMVAANLATLGLGDVKSQKNGPQDCGPSSVADAAKLLEVKPRKVEQAKHIKRDAAKAVVEQVEQNQLTLTTAEKLIKHVTDKAEQAKLAKQGQKAINEHIKQLVTVPAPEPEKPTRARKSLSEAVSAFRRSESKANDLRVIVEELDPSLKALLREWLK